MIRALGTTPGRRPSGTRTDHQPAARREAARPGLTARLLEFGWSDDSPYLVREHVEGRSLRETVAADGPLGGDALGTARGRHAHRAHRRTPVRASFHGGLTPTSRSWLDGRVLALLRHRPRRRRRLRHLDLFRPPSTSARGPRPAVTPRGSRGSPGPAPAPGPRPRPGPGCRARKARGPLRLGRDRRLRGHRATRPSSSSPETPPQGPAGPDEHPARAPLPRRHLPGRASGGPARHQGGHAATARSAARGTGPAGPGVPNLPAVPASPAFLV